MLAASRGVSRAARTLRGAAAAGAATLLAAASHALVGGTVTCIAVVATMVLALPICTALAGRLGSLWRLSAAVLLAQFLYHWSFAGLGGRIAGGGASGSPEPAHAEHLRAVTSFAPQLASAGTANASMWIAHLVAATLTITLLHRGERAVLGLLRLMLRALPLERPRALSVPTAPRSALPLTDFPLPRLRLWVASAITHRGPPAAA